MLLLLFVNTSPFSSGFDPPKIVCRSALGIEDNKLPDSAFTASSQMNANYAPKYARLNYKNADGDFGGWCPQKNDLEQWLQIDLGKVSKITAIATQGRDGEARWTIEYRIMYSLTGGYYMSYKTVNIEQVRLFSLSENLNFINSPNKPSHHKNNGRMIICSLNSLIVTPCFLLDYLVQFSYYF